MPPDWMNWPIWTWIAAAIAFLQGWFLRGYFDRIKERHRRLREEYRHTQVKLIMGKGTEYTPDGD